MGILFLILASCYWLLVAHVPLLGFLGSPSVGVGVWLSAVVVSVGLGVWMVRDFSWFRLAGWLVLTMAVHAVPFFPGDVRDAFEMDACLDTGGVWHGGMCALE